MEPLCITEEGSQVAEAIPESVEQTLELKKQAYTVEQRSILMLSLDVCSFNLIRKRQRITEDDRVSVLLNSSR